MTKKYIIVADDSFKGFDKEIARLEREWGAEEIEPSEDCVSREQALLALTGIDLPTDRDKLIALFTERIQHLPPAAPQLCEYKPFTIGELKNEDMQKLLREFQNQKVLISEHDCMPSVTPERPKGKWIYKCMKGQFCSECDEQSLWKFNYCPNCGAKMEVNDE